MEEDGLGSLGGWLKRSRMSPKQAEEILKQVRRQPKPVTRNYDIGERHVRYGVISDTHIGHKCFNSTLLEFASDRFRADKVDFITHCGDICEGVYPERKGHIYELEHITADEQVDRAVNELGRFEQKIFGITGNHEQNTFYKHLGFDIGKQLQERLPNFEYMGNADATLTLAYGQRVQLLHPDGGSSYAVSYRPQKIIEQIEGGKKPAVLHIGHFHKAMYLFYRNIHGFCAGCFENQTPFMRGKGLAAHLGFWTIDLRVGKKGVTSITPMFYPAYE